jgi:DNA polymerase-3 subunit alpha
MAFVRLEDLKGKAELTVFPDLYERRAPLLQEDNLIYLIGRAEQRGGRTQVVVEELHPLEEAPQLVELRLLLPLEEVDDRLLERLRAIFKESQGETPVLLHLNLGDSQELIKAGEEFAVRLSQRLMEELGKILGAEQIKLVRRRGKIAR